MNEINCIICGSDIDDTCIMVMNVDENFVGLYGVYVCSEECYKELNEDE